MITLKKELDVLTDLMKRQECYRKYQATLKLIQKDPELYAQLNEYRKENVELHYHKLPLKEEAQLERAYHDLLTNDLISEFLHWEQETLKIIRVIHKKVDEALQLDYSFL